MDAVLVRLVWRRAGNRCEYCRMPQEHDDTLYGRKFAKLRSNRIAAPFAGADADAVLKRQDENLAVTDLPGLGRPRCVHDRFDGGLDKGLVDGNLQLQLGQ